MTEEIANPRDDREFREALITIGGDIPLTPRMQNTLAGERLIARRHGHSYLGTEHVLLAFLDDAHGIAGSSLRVHGVVDEVRKTILTILDSDGYRGLPPPRGSSHEGEDE